MSTSLEDAAREAPSTYETFLNLIQYQSGQSISNGKNLRHQICGPAHLLIKEVQGCRFSSGTPGIPQPPGPLEQQFISVGEAIMRGSVHPRGYDLLIQDLGMYILFLWILQSWLADNEEEHSGLLDMQFEYKWQAGGPKTFPAMLTKALTLEWYSVLELTQLAEHFNCENLHLVLAAATDRLEAKENRMRIAENLPFHFALKWIVRDHKKPHFTIRATPNSYLDDTASIWGIFDSMDRFERSIRFQIEWSGKMWERLRNPETPKDILTSCETRAFFELQKATWPDVFFADRKLVSTALLSTAMQDKDVAGKRADPLRRGIDKGLSRLADIKPGNVDRYKHSLTDNDKKILRSITGDLAILHKEKAISPDKLLQERKLKKLTQSDLDLCNREYPMPFNVKDWDDRIVKIAASYLMRKTPEDKRPTLASIEQFLKQAL